MPIKDKSSGVETSRFVSSIFFFLEKIAFQPLNKPNESSGDKNGIENAALLNYLCSCLRAVTLRVKMPTPKIS